MNRHLEFRLTLSADEILKLYRGTTRDVRCLTDDGTRVRFAARHLRPFVTSEGVHGRFRLRFDADRQFLELTKLAD